MVIFTSLESFVMEVITLYSALLIKSVTTSENNISA